MTAAGPRARASLPALFYRGCHAAALHARGRPRKAPGEQRVHRTATISPAANATLELLRRHPKESLGAVRDRLLLAAP